MNTEEADKGQQSGAVEWAEDRFTIEEAFDYFHVPREKRRPGREFSPEGSELNDERCVRSVAFLLNYLSSAGNDDVHGMVAYGLGQILECCADESFRVAKFARKAVTREVAELEESLR
ncbi:MAG: hypothetical protein ACRD8A_15470 [Candidatus Acidiferrales bacterium]